MGFINHTGTFVIDPRFFGAAEFSDGLAAVASDEQRHNWGYIDHAGMYVLEARFSGNSPFSAGLAAQDNHFVNKKGAVVISFDSSAEAASFSDGLAAIRYAHTSTFPASRQNRVEFINPNGEKVFTTRPCASSFSEGLAAVCNQEFLYGFVDKSGRYRIEPEWSRVGRFRSGLAAVCRGCKD